MSWNKEGQRFSANYWGVYEITGVILSSMLRYDDSVYHTVMLDTPITINGAEWFRLVLEENEITITE